MSRPTVSRALATDGTAMSKKPKRKKTTSPLSVESVRKTIATELHGPVRKNFTRRAVELKGQHNLFQAELEEMIPHSRQNKGYKYFMTVINAHSKFAYAIP